MGGLPAPSRCYKWTLPFWQSVRSAGGVGAVGCVIAGPLRTLAARLRTVEVADPHHFAWLHEDRQNAVAQRLARYRLEQLLVTAEPHRLDHLGALAMPGQHDDRHVRPQEAVGRPHGAHETRTVQS